MRGSLRAAALCGALLLPPASGAAKPTTVLEHELRGLEKWSRRLGVADRLREQAGGCLREHEPGRQAALRAVLAPAKRMDAAWGVVWNDWETLRRELPVVRERLGELYRHEKERIVECQRELDPALWVEAAVRLAPRLRARPRLSSRGEYHRAVKGALAAALEAYRLSDPAVVAALERSLQRALAEWDELREDWQEWAEVVEPDLERATYQDRLRWMRALRGEVTETEARVATIVEETLDRLTPDERAGLAVSVLRNLRRVCWVIARFHTVEEIALLE